MTATVIADMLEEGQIDECKQSIKMLKDLNHDSDVHIMGCKTAIKKYKEELK